jgi:hypothetical protein
VIDKVKIGVTGHRDLDISDPLIAAVDRTVREIRDSFHGAKITIISPLAEGADRLVAWRAMANNDADLVVPLPFDVEEYMLDFPKISSKAEFVTLLEQATQVIELPAQENREASYLAVGRYVLKKCNVLIAIWDGLPARGPAGTAQIITQAREQLKPIAWIFAGGQAQNTQSQSFPNKTLYEVTFENFP